MRFTSYRMHLLAGVAFAVVCAIPLAYTWHTLPARLPPAALESHAAIGALDVTDSFRLHVPVRGILASALQTTGPASLLGAIATTFISATGAEPLRATRMAAWMCVAATCVLVAWLALRCARPHCSEWSCAACAAICAAATVAWSPWVLLQSMTYGAAGPVLVMTAVTLLTCSYAAAARTYRAQLLNAAALSVCIMANGEWAIVWIPALVVAQCLNRAHASGWRVARDEALVWAGVVLVLLLWRQDVWLGPHNISAAAVFANVGMLVALVLWGVWLRGAQGTAQVRRALLTAFPLALWFLWWLSCDHNSDTVRTAVRNGLLMSRGDGLYVLAVAARHYTGSAVAGVLVLCMACVGCYRWIRTAPGILWLLAVAGAQLWRSPIHVSNVLATTFIILALAAGVGVAWMGRVVFDRVRAWRQYHNAAWLAGGAPFVLLALLYSATLVPGVRPRVWMDYEAPLATAFRTVDADHTWWRVLDVISNTVPLDARISYTPDQIYFSRFTLTAFARAVHTSWRVVPWPNMLRAPVPRAAEFYIMAEPRAPGSLYLDTDHFRAHVRHHAALFAEDPAWALCVDTSNTIPHVRIYIYARAP